MRNHATSVTFVCEEKRSLREMLTKNITEHTVIYGAVQNVQELHIAFAALTLILCIAILPVIL